MPHDTRPNPQRGAAPLPGHGEGAKVYVMPRAHRPTPAALRQGVAGHEPASDGRVGAVLQFPVRKRGRFDAETRAHLARLAARMPGIQPVSFGYDERGAEWCRFGNGLMMSWEQPGRIILTDTVSGYVDHGPFDSLDEVCGLILGLNA